MGFPTSLIVGGTELKPELQPGFSLPNAVPRATATADEDTMGMEVPDGYDSAPFTFTLVSGTLANSTAVAAWISARRRLFRPGASIVFSEEGAPSLTAYIRHASPDDAANHGDHGELTVSGVRYAAWDLPVRFALDENGDEIDGTQQVGGNDYSAWPLGSPAKVRGSVGETYGRVQAKVVPAQASESILLSCHPTAPSGFAPQQDYQGTEDAAALSGEAATATMTGSWGAIGTESTYDTNLYRAEWGAWARVKNDDATGPTAWRGVAKTSGLGALSSSTSTYTGQEVRATQNNDGYELLHLGTFTFPATDVPDIDTSAAFATTSELVSQKTGATEVALAGASLIQTIGLSAGDKVTGVLLKGHGHGGDMVAIELWSGAGLLGAGETDPGDVPFSPSAEFAILFDTPIIVPSTGTYDLLVSGSGGTPVLLKATDNPYADGELDTGANDDLYFAVLGNVALIFNSGLEVQAKNSTGSKVGSVDTVTLMDAAFTEQVIYTCTSGQGTLIDKTPLVSDRHLAYITTAAADVVGPMQTRIPYGFGVWMPPGDSDWTPLADVPKAAAPTTCALSISYIPVIINRTGGE